jgi:secondary thiamine-phosphate synthase enzyme
MPEMQFDTTAREQLIDITAEVARLIAASGVASGVAHLWCRHTTAGLVCNEHADPDVARDVLMALGKIVADDWPYRHAEGNSPAHVKSILTGCQLTLPVRNGRLALGRWQGIFLAEFDGPRSARTLTLTVIPAEE